MSAKRSGREGLPPSSTRRRQHRDEEKERRHRPTAAPSFDQLPPQKAQRSDQVSGIHSVREILRAGQRPLQYLVVSRERQDARIHELIALARNSGVPIRLEPAARLDQLAGSERHQGVVAVVAAKAVVDLEDLLQQPRAHSPLFLLLDGIEDPHNLGAIIRSACAAGVDAVVLPERRSVGLTETVVRVSAGALEYVPVARVTNMSRALEQLKSAGFWIAGLDEQGQKTLWQQDLTGPLGLVIGAEGAGLHELVRKHCDYLLSIPMAPGVASLNASVACGVVLFEAVRQRTASAASTRSSPK